MYVIRAVKDRLQPQYLADNPEGRRRYRWVAGDEGLGVALRFSSEEEAALTAMGREYYGASARVVWDPRSRGRQPQRRSRGFVIVAVAARRTSYVTIKEGVYCWQHGPDAEAEAFRFSSELIAAKVIAAGFKGSAGGTSRIITVR